MKKFNINECMYVQITKEGWKHLRETVGEDYIKHCIDTEHYRVEIKGEIWHKLQTHSLFELLPVTMGGPVYFHLNVMIDDADLIEQ